MCLKSFRVKLNKLKQPIVQIFHTRLFKERGRNLKSQALTIFFFFLNEDRFCDKAVKARIFYPLVILQLCAGS